VATGKSREVYSRCPVNVSEIAIDFLLEVDATLFV
jgi:hypothetical protein